MINLVLFSKTPSKLNFINCKTRLLSSYPSNTKNKEKIHQKLTTLFFLNSLFILSNLKVEKKIFLSTDTICSISDLTSNCPEFNNFSISQDITTTLQNGESFGNKFNNFLVDHIFSSNNPTIIIGSDSPFITNELLIEAVSELDNNKCVIGPSSRGGVYLIGLTKDVRDLVISDNIFTKEDQIDAFKELFKGKSELHFLPYLADIDYYEDLELESRRVREMNNNSTREVLNHIDSLFPHLA